MTRKLICFKRKTYLEKNEDFRASWIISSKQNEWNEAKSWIWKASLFERITRKGTLRIIKTIASFVDLRQITQTALRKNVAAEQREKEGSQRN